MGALFAAVQRRVALGTSPRELDAWWKCRRAVITARGRRGLDHARQAWSGDIYGWPGTLLAGPVLTGPSVAVLFAV